METKITFDAQYGYAWIKNMGDADCYVSAFPNIQAESKNVAFLPKGECVMIEPVDKYIYVAGETVVECHAQNDAESPFAGGGAGGGSDITVEPLSVTENDTYTAPSGKAYSPVMVNVQPNTNFKYISSNGEYFAGDDELDGYSSVTVSVPTGAEIISRSDWNTLTTAQKQSKGLVAIQDSSTGYERGEFVNGADYVPTGVYIPNSNTNSVICEAYYNNFSLSKDTWGDGSNPVHYMYSNQKPSGWFDEVICNAYQSNVVPYVKLENSNSAFTSYFVGRISGRNSSGARLISCVYSRSTGNGIVIYANNNDMLEISKWGDSIPTPFSYNQDVVIAIRNTSGNNVTIFMYAGSDIETYTEDPYNVGQYLTIARTDINTDITFAEPSEVTMQYLAVVNEAETDAIVEANITALYNQFIAE